MLDSLQKMYKDEPSRAVDEGLKRVIAAMLNRKARQILPAYRSASLRQALGDRFEEVMSLANEINLARLDLVKRGCSNVVCLARLQCGDDSCSPRLGGDSIPTPVRRLFFLNRLCRIVKELPVFKFNEQDWESLIVEARSDLRGYRMWRTQDQTVRSSDSAKRQRLAPSEKVAVGIKRPKSEDSSLLLSRRNVRRRTRSL
jgi:hypothetical protein